MAAFAERGFSGTTFGDVAARAGLSNGALYHYFETKEGLFEAVIQERLVPSMAADEAMLAAAHGGARDDAGGREDDGRDPAPRRAGPALTKPVRVRC